MKAGRPNFTPSSPDWVEFWLDLQRGLHGLAKPYAKRTHPDTLTRDCGFESRRVSTSRRAGEVELFAMDKIDC